MKKYSVILEITRRNPTISIKKTFEVISDKPKVKDQYKHAEELAKLKWANEYLSINLGSPVNIKSFNQAAKLLKGIKIKVIEVKPI